MSFQSDDHHKNVNGTVENDDEEKEEESDEYEETDDEGEGPDEEEKGEGGGEEEQKNTLTHLLLGNPNGVTAETATLEYNEDEEDDEDEGDEVDDDDDDDSDDEYVDGDGDDTGPPTPALQPHHSTKKRSIDKVDEEASSPGSKRIKV